VIAHHTWQIDSKEQVKLKDGQEVSWVNIACEATTAHLMAGVQNVKRASQICPRSATQIVNKCFERWGLPQEIKIDNGYPFVNPNYMNIPTKAKLWWIGLGIKCLQGICSRWVNPILFENEYKLQRSLNEVSDFQRNDYQIPGLGYQTRIELYPELEKNLRKYDPQAFNMELVDQYLSQQIWERAIKEKGSVHFFGKEIYLSQRFGKQDTFITYDPRARQWIFRDRKGTFLKASTLAVPNRKEIIDFAVMSKN